MNLLPLGGSGNETKLVSIIEAISGDGHILQPIITYIDAIL